MQKISAGKFHFEPPSRFTSFDHLVGAHEERLGDRQSDRLRRLVVDRRGHYTPAPHPWAAPYCHKRNATHAVRSPPPLKALPEKSDAIAAALSISIRGPRPSWPVGRRRPRWCARSSWRHQTLACGCRSSPHPVVSDDG